MKTKVAILLIVSFIFLSACSLLQPEENNSVNEIITVNEETPSPTPTPLIEAPTAEPEVKGPGGKLPPIK